MNDTTSRRRAAQLDTAERERLETVVAEMRDRIEDNVRFQLAQRGLETPPTDGELPDEDVRELADAIRLERTADRTWDEAVAEYVTGVGYTVVNRLAALRCMEVRGFLDEEVTVFTEGGLTPAAETLVHEEFLLEDEAVLRAYHDACDELADELGILFDRGSPHSLLTPDTDAFEELCGSLDEMADDVWRADDVLGWVYEYYNRPVVEALDAKNTLDPDDVGPANQFYTPHWVVRMLADNSLGKLYLEATGQESTVPAPGALSPDERKERSVTPEHSPSVADLCTYLIPDEDDQATPEFSHPRDLRVIDPACGSGHFLLYAFDILERIWWAETTLDRGEIPAKILEHNLHGVDIDLRSCQLSAFNLYLKARTRTEAEGSNFEMPNVDIVCADARVAEIEEAADVLDEIAGEDSDLRAALDGVIAEFEATEALGSLLDVQGALEDEFESGQSELSGFGDDGPHTLNAFLRELEAAVEERTAKSFGERNLRSVLNLLVVLTQDYDVALMNPPYGSGGRMPDDVQAYVREHYEYTTEYYINFFEACDRLVTADGRIGMLVPWSFMFRKSFEPFRSDFIGGEGSFDFFAEFGYDVLDNAMVGTVGTVVRTIGQSGGTGTFIRLPDVDKGDKERTFLTAAFGESEGGAVERKYERELSEFRLVPGTPLSYWVPKSLRSLYDSPTVLDADNAGLNRESAGTIKQGLATADDDRFVRRFWETTDTAAWSPFAKGGSDAVFLPRIKHTVLWEEDGAEIRRYGKSRPQNTQHYRTEGLTYTVFKRAGRRFGYLHPESIFSHVGSAVLPNRDIWTMLSFLDSHLLTYLMLCQTQERNWDVGLVAAVPWREALESESDLAALSKEAVGQLVSKRRYDIVSPHYDGPVLLDVMGVDTVRPWRDHPHRELRERLTLEEPKRTLPTDASLDEIGVAAAKHLERVDANLQACTDAIDEAVFNCFDISENQRGTVLREIALRTIEDPRERETYDPDGITEPTEEFPEQVKDLLHHLTLRIVREDDDGIVALSDVDRESDLLDRIAAEFGRIWGEHADARLAEVDDLLGSETADEEAYPNLRAWLAEDLFEYHVSTFDRTPILWRLTTDRLVSDSEGEGLGCLVDYHQFDSATFDRLSNRYLEPRTALLREHRSAANRRRSDESLSASERASAAAAYERCESGLEQISVFEDRLSELARPSPRELPEDVRTLAESTVDRVAEFRERTAGRLETLDDLLALGGVDPTDLFSPTFYETVQENREEWLDGLEALEAAFDAYAAPGSEPVEAHRYDLFEYYGDLVGTPHYASNGILFMTYYFDRLEGGSQAQIGDGGVSERERLCSELAEGLDGYRALADEITRACEVVAGGIDAGWERRALSEITTAGYRPNHKHGVEINIRPLAEAEIVPKVVDDDVV